MIRLLLLHTLAHWLGFELLYVVRFIPANPKRTELRGRTHFIADNPTDAIAYWNRMQAGQHLKEKTRGTYYLAVEGRAGNFAFDPAESQRGSRTADDIADNGPAPGEPGLFSRLPSTAQGGPEAADSPQAEADEGDRAEGDRAGDQHDAGTEALAGPDEPVVNEYVTSASMMSPAELKRLYELQQEQGKGFDRSERQHVAGER